MQRRQSPVPIMIQLLGLRSGTLRRASTSTSVSPEYMWTEFPWRLTATAYNINSVSASSCILGILTVFGCEEKVPFCVCVVIGILHNQEYIMEYTLDTTEQLFVQDIVKDWLWFPWYSGMTWSLRCKWYHQLYTPYFVFSLQCEALWCCPSVNCWCCNCQYYIYINITSWFAVMVQTKQSNRSLQVLIWFLYTTISCTTAMPSIMYWSSCIGWLIPLQLERCQLYTLVHE